MNNMKSNNNNNGITDTYSVLEKSVYAALETYSNVHRGSGHYSMTTTRLFEQARKIILEYLVLSKRKYVLIFCTPRRASILTKQIKSSSYQVLSGRDFGLPLGVRALAVIRNALPGGVPFQTGGGSARLISGDWVVWESAPDRFESGTPAIINVIAFARALQIIQQSGNDIFKNPAGEKLSARDILYHDELENYTGEDLLDKLKQSLIGRGIPVPTAEGLKPFINLDYAASTPTFLPVWNAVRQTWRQSKQVQREIIQEVRKICADLLGAPQADYDMVFTSNTTEAINLAAESIGREKHHEIEPVVITTLLEHSSNDLPWRVNPGHSLITLPIDKEGFLDLNGLDKLLNDHNVGKKFGKKRIKLVAVSGASNVLGTFNNLAEISRIVHKYGARLLVDAAQLVAHRKVDLEACGADYFTFSAHKVYAPFGTGVLVVKKGLLSFGSDEMELINSSGEENVGGLAALGKALLLLKRIGMDVIKEEEQQLTEKILKGLAQIPEIQIYGITDTDSPTFYQRGGVVVFNLIDKMSDVVARGLALKGGIGIRYGCHCTHVLIKHLLNVGPKLEQFQKFIVTLLPRVQLPGVARVSLGIGNSEEE
ncbi:MAG TPA: aminotransferase class V-fold PLP-dependent enzyme, partial [Draconibacterium sp.]|nr:aminotransferase class V-fold PLP-dependent enzyme [Draconibacterium sp.]